MTNKEPENHYKELRDYITREITSQLKKMTFKEGDILVMHKSLFRDFRPIELETMKFQVPIILVDDMGHLEKYNIGQLSTKFLNKIGYYKREQFELNQDVLADALNDQYSKYKILTIAETLVTLTKRKDLIRVKEEK